MTNQNIHLVSSSDVLRNWKFILEDVSGASAAEYNDTSWLTISLPHTARIEQPVTGGGGAGIEQWQGICWYRKTISIPQLDKNHFAILKFHGAMNVADIWVNGRHITRHHGGFLPFCIELHENENVLAVRLDNTDNPITGPRPLAQLDFNTYGGLYRPVELIIKNRLHITDSIHAGKTASGGVFITTTSVSNDSAVLTLKTHILNAYLDSQQFTLHYELKAPDGSILSSESGPLMLNAGQDRIVESEIRINNPKLWTLENPSLYTLICSVIQNGKSVDVHKECTGIRQIRITPDGFFLNGQKQFLRGVNRHQEYPCLGYALSDNAQYRDAKTIKDAGFDYIRLSHYPQSPAFLSACDELGIVVMNCIPGWQYFNDNPAFSEYQYDCCRTLIRRDRNHPCVILWEVSLNETSMPAEFIKKTHGIAHAEMPGDQMYTCGWQNGYDVFIQARQHGGCKGVTKYPCVISEYGDWEYYARNDGLNQQGFRNLHPIETSSRQARGDGEIRLLHQVRNFQEAHNSNLLTPAFADGLWVMFDYNRGYIHELEKSGCMDIYRLPKFSTYFFASQRSPSETVAPMVFIANYHNPASPRKITVFCNAEEVALFQNGQLIARSGPNRNAAASCLNHPPFLFDLKTYEPGILEAVAYIHGKEVARHSRCTAESSEHLVLQANLQNRPLQAGKSDAIFVYASVVDRNETIIPDASQSITFTVDGPTQLIGPNPVPAEAGIAAILLHTDGENHPVCITASAPGLTSHTLTLTVSESAE